MAASPITPRVLVVENDPGLRVLLAALLTDEGYRVVSASSLPQALALSEVQVFHSIFTTRFPQGQEDPLRSVGSLRAQTWPTPIVVLSRDDVSETEARRRVSMSMRCWKLATTTSNVWRRRLPAL